MCLDTYSFQDRVPWCTWMPPTQVVFPHRKYKDIRYKCINLTADDIYKCWHFPSELLVTYHRKINTKPSFLPNILEFNILNPRCLLSPFEVEHINVSRVRVYFFSILEAMLLTISMVLDMWAGSGKVKMMPWATWRFQLSLSCLTQKIEFSGSRYRAYAGFRGTIIAPPRDILVWERFSDFLTLLFWIPEWF